MYILEPVRLVQKEGQPFGLFFFLGYTVGRAAQLFGLKRLGTVKPPLRNSQLCSVFTPHLQRGLEAVLETVHPFHVGAKSALLRRFFMLTHKKASSARSLAPPFQIATAHAGLQFGFWFRPGGMSSKLFGLHTWSQSPLCNHDFYAHAQKSSSTRPPCFIIKTSLWLSGQVNSHETL